MAGVQGPLKGPGSSQMLWCSLVLYEPLIVKHSDTKWDTENIVGQILGGRLLRTL